MNPIISLNEWESQFFKRKIGTVVFDRSAVMDAIFSAQDYDLITAKVSTDTIDQIDWLQQNEFELVEGSVEFSLDLANYRGDLTACYRAEPQDLASLSPLFSTAFPHSRFRPPYFLEEENQRFYHQWIRNSLSGEFDDLCLVERDEKQNIIGGVSLRIREQTAQIGLLAVNAHCRGKGIGKKLMQQSISWAIAQQATQLKIVTQLSNLAGIQLYQSFQAKITQTHYWFYRQC
ncbi:dTDP-4-amino-4,6-dideoxy-D-galactose acyltransferase [Otariodibacter oris]|uniref:dTDP-4-amino-4,6-dideoxy-D-galactose acyltransferase n=1 Tax=Otariodibacter oris TaxID=1032623 RepID=A0A420XED3_9PAST|nr:dTDP-4-amino-4,6-dideoxy-D-galactose acyltransferase [Otariodibacter oris]RKR70506.1 dTDP-4-amino-4,6-dideoxy-D-galactose acyltransferase [Otariodibacter oris]